MILGRFNFILLESKGRDVDFCSANKQPSIKFARTCDLKFKVHRFPRDRRYNSWKIFQNATKQLHSKIPSAFLPRRVSFRCNYIHGPTSEVWYWIPKCIHAVRNTTTRVRRHFFPRLKHLYLSECTLHYDAVRAIAFSATKRPPLELHITSHQGKSDGIYIRTSWSTIENWKKLLILLRKRHWIFQKVDYLFILFEFIFISIFFNLCYLNSL